MDQALFHLINERWTSRALDLFMGAVSDVEIWKPLLVVLGLYALIFLGFKGRAFVLCLGLILLVTDAFVVPTLKSAIARPRPKQVQTVRMVHLQKASPKFLTLFQRPTIRFSGEKDRRNSGSSFPSGHVTDNVAIGVCCAFFFRRWGWLYFFFAGAVGYSRIYLGAHWPSDVLGTAVLAAVSAIILLALLEFLWRRAGPRWWPGLFAIHPSLRGEPQRSLEPAT
ncbi:MAG: phosphatase PAP2 family protein [Chthoniobacterales bacterium]